MVMALASCATGNSTSKDVQLNGEWSVTKIDGKQIDNISGLDAPFLGFRDSQLYGSTSCNRLTGEVKVDKKKGTIDFGNTGSTRMMCHDMQTEQKMLNAMGRAVKFSVSGKTLTLTDSKGKAVMELDKK